MSCGIIARCDAGGLGSISREVFRHLQPDRTLLLDLGASGRGSCAESAYDVEGARQSVYRADWHGGLPDRAVEWLCAEGIDTLWSAETFYDDKVLTAARHANIRTVCYAMPELAPWAVDRALRPRPQELLTPTGWRAEHMPEGTEVLPMPVARDRLPYRQRTEVRHLFHVTGKAMCDRNGTDLLLRALPHLRNTDVKLTIRSERNIVLQPDTRIPVAVDRGQCVDYWDAYPASIDLLVMPRRYGGLCLPVQECASLGVPSLMLDSDPYAWSSAPVEKIPTSGSRDIRMKGGIVPVFDADPRNVAAAIDHLIEHPDDVATLSRWADRWAADHSWDSLAPMWCELLDADCGALAA